MVANKKIDQMFDWGESVQILDSAPQEYARVRIGDVCGMRTIENDQTAKEFTAQKGSMLYLVEGSDGFAIEVPAKYLEKYVLSNLD